MKLRLALSTARPSRPRLTPVLCIASAFNLAPLQAADVSLGFTTLPGVQGWTYVSSAGGPVETDIFAVSGTSLSQNSFGRGPIAPTYYQNLFPVFNDQPFVLTFTARVTASENFTFSHPFGFSIYVNNQAGDTIAFGLHTGRIGDGTLIAETNTVDTTVFHNYRVEGQFGASGYYRLFVDDLSPVVPVLTGAPTPNGSPSGLFLGDGSFSGNANAELTSYRFIQIPEPSVAAALLAGLGSFAVRRRRR